MDIELLKTFLEVRKTRHFGKAAENLQLTREGERLVAHAQTVLLAWSRARQELALKTGQSTQVHIGVRAGL